MGISRSRRGNTLYVMDAEICMSKVFRHTVMDILDSLFATYRTSDALEAGEVLLDASV